MQDVIQFDFLLLVLAAALLPAGPGRVLAAAGAISGGLALAGARAGPVEPSAGSPGGFLAVEAALFATGAALGIAAAAVSAKIRRASGAQVLGAAAAVVAGLGAARSAVPYLRVAPPLAVLASAAVTSILGLAIGWAGARASRPPEASNRFPVSFAGMAAIGAGALFAAAGPRADLILLGAMLAAAGGWAGVWSRDGRRLPVAPALTLPLVPAWWLMRTIAGPEGLATGSLSDLPWSPAAERLLAAMLLLSAWAMSGLWPLHREEPAALTAPVAALLVARVAIPAFPGGLEHWRALVLPLVLVGLWHGVLTGNRGEALVGLAWVGLAAATNGGQAGAGLILVGTLMFRWADRRARLVESVSQPIAALAVGAGAFLVIEAGLRTEVVYTACAVAALVAATGLWGRAQASTATAPSATAPSA